MQSNSLRIALVGQPNAGKSQLLNALSGASLKVGNFAGTTLERKEINFCVAGCAFQVIDLPGLYSLTTYSPEEEVTKQFLLDADYDLIINVVDASNLRRHLNLTLQLLDMGKKMILAVNMFDIFDTEGGKLDLAQLEILLGIPVIATSAHTGQGLHPLLQHMRSETNNDVNNGNSKLLYDRRIEEAVERLALASADDLAIAAQSRFYLLRLLEGDRQIYRILHDKPIFAIFYPLLLEEQENLAILCAEPDCLNVIVNARNAMIQGIMTKVLKKPVLHTITGKIDRILIHPLWGLPTFFFIIWLIFQATFQLGAYPMAWIDSTLGTLMSGLEIILPTTTLSRALTDGLLPAMGAVLSFLPNILILFLCINLLEQTGYMARAAFLLDGTMKQFGLHGKAFIPLVSGFGCSVPAYMAAHTLKNPKTRLLTLIIIGFLSCSARLPVYVLFISAFFPPEQAGNVLFAIYLFGVFVALTSAKLLHLTLFRGAVEPFVMEMPRYRLPSVKALLRDLQFKALIFLRRIGLYIGTISMVIWFLSAYPLERPELQALDQQIAQTILATEKGRLELERASVQLHGSYIGILGQAIQPIFAPLGFDWKLSVATITALMAKEAAVGTLGTLYMIEGGEQSDSLVEQVRKAIDFKAAIAFLFVMMLYSPCIAAMSTFFGEVNVWKWRIFYLLYPNLLAWTLGFLVYQGLWLVGV